MKNKFVKTLVVFGLSFIAWNCSEDAASPQGPNNNITAVAKPALEVDQSCWMLVAGTQIFLIVPNADGTFSVTDEYSVPVGIFDVGTASIIDASGTPVVANVDLTQLPVVNPDKTISYIDGSKATIDGKTILLPGGIDPNAGTSVPVVLSSSSAGPLIVASSSSVAKPMSATATSSSQKAEDPKPASSSSKAPEEGKIGSITYKGSLSQTVAKGGAISPVTFSGLKSHPSRQSWNLWSINDSDCKYDESAKTFTINGTVSKDISAGEVSETWIMDGTAVTLTVEVTDGSGTTKKSSSSQKQETKSSSSQAKSSSGTTTATSSSSKANNSGTSVELKYVQGGRSGKGWATRYWDCCKPHCSWPEHAHGNYSKQCTNKGTKESTDWGGGSVCSGGGLMTCTSQIPIIVNDSLAYAFAAVPAADGGSCGKCYALAFDGRGKYERKTNHMKLEGKILVVMATNIGGDVQQGQFDVMIPGGGVGLFNGCSSMGWGKQGEQYGGLLSECEKEVGTAGNLLTKRKDCLAEKCAKSFANDEKAKEGCMFLATWMEAAGNPTHNYREVECPAALKAQY
jgi:hypothetical protein